MYSGSECLCVLKYTLMMSDYILSIPGMILSATWGTSVAQSVSGLVQRSDPGVSH